MVKGSSFLPTAATREKLTLGSSSSGWAGTAFSSMLTMLYDRSSSSPITVWLGVTSRVAEKELLRRMRGAARPPKPITELTEFRGSICGGSRSALPVVLSMERMRSMMEPRRLP